ncbi:MAG: flagellar hook-length control protein FliK [Pseudomonadota bacterium]
MTAPASIFAAQSVDAQAQGQPGRTAQVGSGQSAAAGAFAALVDASSAAEAPPQTLPARSALNTAVSPDAEPAAIPAETADLKAEPESPPVQDVLDEADPETDAETGVEVGPGERAGAANNSDTPPVSPVSGAPGRLAGPVDAESFINRGWGQAADVSTGGSGAPNGAAGEPAAPHNPRRRGTPIPGAEPASKPVDPPVQDLLSDKERAQTKTEAETGKPPVQDRPTFPASERAGVTPATSTAPTPAPASVSTAQPGVSTAQPGVATPQAEQAPAQNAVAQNTEAAPTAQAQDSAQFAAGRDASTIAMRREAALERVQRSEAVNTRSALRAGDAPSSSASQAADGAAAPVSSAAGEPAPDAAARTDAAQQPNAAQPQPAWRAALAASWMTPAQPVIAATNSVPLDAPPADLVTDPSLDAAQGERLEARAEAHRGQGAAHQAGAQRFSPTAAHALAAHIARKAVDGAHVFDIRLDPPELGRVEVRLEMRAGEKVSAVLSAERADALAELQRSARDLEKALNEAGLELDENGLSFELAGDQTQEREPDGDEPASQYFTLNIERDEAGDTRLSRPVELYGFALNARGGLDMRA